MMTNYLTSIIAAPLLPLKLRTNFRLPSHLKSASALIIIILNLTLIANPSTLSAADTAEDTTRTVESPSTYLLALEPDLTEAERIELLQSHNAELVRWIPEINLAEVHFIESQHPGNVRSDTSVTAVMAMAAQLASDPAVEFIEENTVVRGTGTVQTKPFSPDDPELYNTTNGYAQQLLQMESAWGHTLGSESVIIAVLDTGVDTTHPELADQLVPGYDFVNDTAHVIDDNGHGTHVSGIIAASINNNQGSAGICPRCKLMPLKVLDKNNVGVWTAIVHGIIFAVDNGAKVINLSLGSADRSQSVQRAVEYAQENGALLVAAAGNSRSRELFFPAAFAGVLSVSATDNEDRMWSLSNQGTYIDVAAPGYLIYSTSINAEQYSYMTGTSMAAPFVSGLAGLILSQSPHSSAADLSDRIIHNTVDLGNPGWDSIFGFGRVDAYAAMAETGTAQSTSPSGSNNIVPEVYLPFVKQ